MANKVAKKLIIHKSSDKKPQSFICLRKPDRVILHYGIHKLELATTEMFSKQIVTVDEDSIDKYTDFMYTGD